MKNNKKYHIITFILIALLSSSCIGVNQEFKNIRSKVIDSLDDDFDRQFEFSIGPVGFFLASQFVKFADTEENVDQMLSKVKKMSIGIYDRHSNNSKPSLSLLKNISSGLIDENWKSIVKSIDGNEMVGVYVKEDNPDDIEEIFIVTLTNDELIMVKLQGSLGSIIELVIREHGHNIRVADHS